MQIYFCGMPALAVFNFGNAVYSAIGNTRKPLFFLSIAGVTNVLLNLFFVIVCRIPGGLWTGISVVVHHRGCRRRCGNEAADRHGAFLRGVRL